MFKRSARSASELVGQAYGVTVTLEGSNRRALKLLSDALPVEWQDDSDQPSSATFRLSTTDNRTYVFSRDGQEVVSGDADATVAAFDWMLRNHIAVSAADFVFIHAGTVAHGGRAIVIPGQSFSGKTTLVKALIGAGAVYYSDEYAVIGRDGLLHPYAKPLSVRGGVQGRQNEHASELGGTVGVEPVPIGLVVSTHYKTGVTWQPTQLARSEAVLELMAHTFAAQDRPQSMLGTLSRAVATAQALKGDRGDAAAVAPLLLERLAG